MSMAHDSHVRRSDDPYRDAPRQPAGGQGAGDDPLAELARLIGRDDPFADLGKRQAQGAAGPHADTGPGAPDWLARPDHAARGRADEGPAYDQQAAGHDPYGQHDPRYDDPQYAGSEAYQGAYAADGSQNPDCGYENDPYYGDGHQPPQGDDYDQPPPEKRRGGLMTVAAVVALAVFGTGSVFAYRAWTGPTKSGEPPVIKAEQTPTKTVPAQSGDGQAKQVYDRPSDRGGERIVPREEQPTDVRTATTRPVTPGVISGGSAPGSVLPPLANPASQTGAVPAPGEPKKVKTVVIRPDQAGGAPMQTPTPPPSSRGVAPVAPPQGATPVQTMQVTPRANPAPAPGPAPQIAARPAPESVETGSYLVQVSSQRSEADAQATYRALQAKYPSVLGTRRPIIKRVDLGDKGIYFRAHVGPFASAEEATEMCNSLRAANGQCVVQRN
jgi:hypothetical protein